MSSIDLKIIDARLKDASRTNQRLGIYPGCRSNAPPIGVTGHSRRERSVLDQAAEVAAQSFKVSRRKDRCTTLA